jgi:hypothetical protein
VVLLPAAMGICAVLRGSGDALVLTVSNEETGRRIAVVEGSRSYVEKALLALRSLATPVRFLSEDGDRGQGSFVRRKPAHRDAKRTR